MADARVSGPARKIGTVSEHRAPAPAKRYQRPIVLSDDEDSEEDTPGPMVREVASANSAKLPDATSRPTESIMTKDIHVVTARPTPTPPTSLSSAPLQHSKSNYSFPEPTKNKMQFNPSLSVGANGRGVVDLISSSRTGGLTDSSQPIRSSGELYGQAHVRPGSNGLTSGKSNNYAFANSQANGGGGGAFGSSLPAASSPFKRAQAEAVAKEKERVRMMNMAAYGYPNPNARPIGLQRPLQPGGVPIAPPPAFRPHEYSAHPSKPAPDDGEDFDSALHSVTAAPSSGDYDRVSATEAGAHMRELLSSAMGGDGEDAEMNADIKEEEYPVEGFAKGMRLMPHQVRGVRWMRGRESGKKYGGILADDMGLGKTVQTLARIIEGKPTPAERKAGFTGGTLIIAPLAVMEQWATECKTKTRPGTLKVTTHHGPSRTKSATSLQDYDVVITTFQTVVSEFGVHSKSSQARLDADDSDDSDDSDNPRFGKSVKGRGKGGKKVEGHAGLFGVKWLRIVVDEAQNIKNRNTMAAKAAVALEAKYRWCLTGTPIQNSVEELFSLFRFLRARPLDQWDVFRDRIAKPVKEGRTKFAMKRLHVVLKAIMLRRTKDATMDGKPILNLPARVVTITNCEFDASERDFYDALEKKQKVSFDKFVAAGTAMSNYTSVLTLLLRMRQACCHPALVTNSLGVDQDAIESRPAAQEEETDDLANLLGGLGVGGVKVAKCDICGITLADPSVRNCDECANISRKARAMSTDFADSGKGLPTSSSKIKMMMKLLREIKERSDGSEKTIVFSQFTSFLNLLEPFLKAEGVRHVRYDGSMRNDKRQAALAAIKDDPNIKVILISFKAGSTGLNLTCCNNVILLDLWWNPALEDQAFDRSHRLGQKLDVNIYKLTVTDSVEDRILKLQDAKRDLANAALSGQATNAGKLNLMQMMDLFRRDHREDKVDDDFKPQTRLATKS